MLLTGYILFTSPLSLNATQRKGYILRNSSPSLNATQRLYVICDTNKLAWHCMLHNRHSALSQAVRYNFTDNSFYNSINYLKWKRTLQVKWNEL